MSNKGEPQLYGAFADRYDLHTPPDHYRHDHEYLLALAQDVRSDARILDVGCGTGIFVEKALARGFDAHGLDPAPDMLAVAGCRVAPARLSLGSMQGIDGEQEFDVITALSWSFNYCQDFDEAQDVLGRFHRALRPGGRVALQLAHAPHAPKAAPDFMVDVEAGPGGEDDIRMSYRFWSPAAAVLVAEYAFECRSTSESFQECHELHAADAWIVAERARVVGFADVQLLAGVRGASLDEARSMSPFLLARR